MTNPIADVILDVPLAHLDRPFEYAVPASLSDAAQPGVRVRVRFAGQDRNGYLTARKSTADHGGKLTPLTRVISTETVLTPPQLQLCRTVADRWAGTLADVLRLAIPPRHARAEHNLPPTQEKPPAEKPTTEKPDPRRGPWGTLNGGLAFLDRLAAGQAPRAVWTATPAATSPCHDWPYAIADAVATTARTGKGALIVVPDSRDVSRVSQTLTDHGSDHVTLTADLGPQARYTAWLKVSRGLTRIVVGTRAAMFAPVHHLGLVVCWDDGDDLHAEPRAPYPHVREVLAIRSKQENTAALFGGFARTAETHRWVQSGWARPVQASSSALREAAPRILLAGEGVEQERDAAAVSARLPSLAWRTAQQALRYAPVLIQVPRRGYVPSVACQQCRQPARCPHCHGPLEVTGPTTEPACRWCAQTATTWSCPHCRSHLVRSIVVGAERTAHELGRAFPTVPVITSSTGHVLARVAQTPALVIATPGAEPVADGGYGAALLLDGWALLGRSDLRASEEALRRWMNAAALVRPSAEGGQVVLVNDGGVPPVEALIRWNPSWHAERELAERAGLNFPPAAVVLTLTGTPAAIQELLDVSDLPSDTEILGPVPIELSPKATLQGRSLQGRSARKMDGAEQPLSRMLLRTSPASRLALARAVQVGAAVRSARKSVGTVRVQVDPLDLV